MKYRRSVGFSRLRCRRAPSTSALCLFAALAASSCTSSGGDDDKGAQGGEGGGGEGGQAGQSGGGEGGGSEGGSGGSGGAVMPAGAEVCGPLAPAPIRRLSETEYLRTLSGLLPKMFPAFEDGVTRFDSHFLKYTRPGTAKLEVDKHLRHLMVKDPNTFGFNNRAKNLNPTPLGLEVYDELAGSIAEALVLGTNGGGQPLNALELPCSDNSIDCGKTFIESFGKKVFRRPLTAEEKGIWNKFFEEEFKAAESAGGGVNAFKAALLLTIEALLQSPQFLYRIEVGDPDTKSSGAIKLTQYEIANRLSYMLWSGMPDDELFEAADKGELATKEQREAQARRMMASKNFRYRNVEFFRQWADFERIFAESYRLKPGRNVTQPGHSFEIFYLLGLREEVSRFVEWVFSESDGSLKTLFTGTKTWATPHVKAIYEGKTLPDYAPPGDWEEYQVNPEQRAGILTRPIIAWSYSHFSTPNPPVRGSFILSKVLCQPPPAPPGDAMALAGSVQLPAGASNREQFVARLKAANNCPSCHNVMDPPGFAMENYNDVGMFITKDEKNGKTIDASGNLQVGSDVDGPFKNIIELTKRFGESTSVRKCMTTQFYEYVTGRDAEGSLLEDTDGVDKCRLSALDQAVADANGDLREAFVKFAGSDDFIWRAAY